MSKDGNEHCKIFKKRLKYADEYETLGLQVTSYICVVRDCWLIPYEFASQILK